MKTLMTIALIAGLTAPAWADDPEKDPVQEAMQRLVQMEEKNAEELEEAAGAVAQATEEAAQRVKKALTPMAQKLAARAKAETPDMIDAVAEQRRASTKMLTGALSMWKKMTDEVAKK
jgi:aminopeptidase N